MNGLVTFYVLSMSPYAFIRRCLEIDFALSSVFLLRERKRLGLAGTRGGLFLLSASPLEIRGAGELLLQPSPEPQAPARFSIADGSSAGKYLGIPVSPQF